MFDPVYLLTLEHPTSLLWRTTYIGSTTNLETRYRQHNGTIWGGAVPTTSHRLWEMLAFVHGFQDKLAWIVTNRFL